MVAHSSNMMVGEKFGSLLGFPDLLEHNCLNGGPLKFCITLAGLLIFNVWKKTKVGS